MDPLHSLNGMVQVEITSADIGAALNAAQNSGIPIYQAVSIDDLTIRILLRRQDRRKLVKLLEKRGDSIRILGKRGIFWVLQGVLGRPVLVAGMLALMLITALVPTRIWFFRVEGNQTIPTNQILEQAQLCGISFGASRREVRSEKVKNALLQALPQLQWAGVNTSGCVATISVREREEKQDPKDLTGISSIVAERDGLILSCTVTRGSAACTVGQAVEAGQLLISGYTDCGLSIRACRAEGEVYARTERSLSAVMATEYALRTDKTDEIRKYSLIVGKKRINFYKDSGILPGSCVKMVTEKNLTLPGGFVLPVVLVTEVWQSWDSAASQITDADLGQFADQYLQGQMIAGQILSAEETVIPGEGILSLESKYACHEMIGRVQNEEIIKPNGKSD